jgi:leucyl aminopeptidase (aminopeptidase T)
LSKKEEEDFTMFDAREYFKAENDPVQEKYEETIKIINTIVKDTMDFIATAHDNKIEYWKFVVHTGNWILRLCTLEKNLYDAYFHTKPFEKLLRENYDLYAELRPENYDNSYANPKYCVNVFGESFGQLISFFYDHYYRKYIEYAYSHKIFNLEENNRLFIQVYNYLTESNLDYEELKKIITAPQFTTNPRDSYIRYNQRFDPAYSFYTDIINNADLSDLRYLLRSGHFVSDNEIRITQFLLNYSKNKLQKLSKEIVKAYIKGFKEGNKDITKKSTVGLWYKLGLEPLYREIINEFKGKGLECTVLDVFSTEVNKQYKYDHKFDNALFISDEFLEKSIDRFTKGHEQTKEFLSEHSGLIYFSKFGEQPFTPEMRKENLKLSDVQTKIFQNLNNELYRIHVKYIPQSETSFCMVAFPIPDLGEKFEEIFEATVEINMLDSDKYERIQQKLIDVLDLADFIHVKGKEGNETDIVVKMQELKEPEKETNFINSGASTNIPVGEVYTTPQLKGTNGILHVEETYLGGFKYTDLKMAIKDGYIKNYSCTNFDNKDDNNKYIEENLIFPHKTLPIGEFAIGTNTLAYIVARKYNIIDVLPVLILEKTGPHFALGDSCAARKEDLTIHNQINDKIFVATDNEKSILRKTNAAEAYTNKHTDITLAFDSIEFITVITHNEERIDIIRDGRFTLKGTQDLNKALEEGNL